MLIRETQLYLSLAIAMAAIDVLLWRELPAPPTLRALQIVAATLLGWVAFGALWVWADLHQAQRRAQLRRLRRAAAQQHESTEESEE